MCFERIWTPVVWFWMFLSATGKQSQWKSSNFLEKLSLETWAIQIIPRKPFLDAKKVHKWNVYVDDVLILRPIIDIFEFSEFYVVWLHLAQQRPLYNRCVLYNFAHFMIAAQVCYFKLLGSYDIFCFCWLWLQFLQRTSVKNRALD